MKPKIVSSQPSVAAPALVHEAENQRQHVRVKLPAKVTLGERTFDTGDWSVGGFSIDRMDAPPAENDRVPVTMAFAFNGFRFLIDVEARVASVRGGGDRVGFQFVDLAERDLSILQYLIGAYLSGEVVETDDILTIAARDNLVRPRGTKSAAAPAAGPFEIARRILLLAVLWAVVASVVVMLGSSLYDRLFMIKSLGVVTSPNASTVTSPRTGIVAPIALQRGARVKQGDLLLNIDLGEDQNAALQSTCDCIVAEIGARAGDLVQKGTPLMTLAPADDSLLVHATIPLEAAPKVTIGDRASVFLLTERVSVAGRVAAIDAPGFGLSRLSAGGPGSEPFVARATIVLDKPLPARLLGEAATAAIDTSSFTPFWEPTVANVVVPEPRS